MALIYPNSYSVGMSSLGFQLVYKILNERDDLVCERFFLPEKNSTFLSVESGRTLQDFPLIFYSVSFEHDYVNIVRTLLLGGITPLGKKRRAQENTPLVICGGVAAFMNPEPIADFIDLFLIGEAEVMLDSFMDHLLGNLESDKDSLLLDSARKYEGVYVPNLYEPLYDDKGYLNGMKATKDVPETVCRLVLEKCERAGHSELLSPEAEFSNLYLTELGRGCSRGCRFCAAGFIYRPPRIWESNAIISALSERSSATNRVGLLGMEMAGDKTLDLIAKQLLDGGCSLSFSSLRADKIGANLLDLLQKSELKSVAIAPDGASERLRRVINKGIKEEDILKAVQKLVTAGIFKLKLYVMVGLPTETDEDLQEMVDLVKKVKKAIDPIGQERGRLTEIFLSVNCFVPKPWTPFQFHPFGLADNLQKFKNWTIKDSINNLKAKITYLKKGVKEIPNVHFQAEKPDSVLFQAVLARGDRRLSGILNDVASAGVPWKSSMKRHGLKIEDFVCGGENVGNYFPWYIINQGIKKEFLWEEYQKAFTSSLTKPCDTALCKRCGVCGEREERKI